VKVGPATAPEHVAVAGNYRLGDVAAAVKVVAVVAGGQGVAAVGGLLLRANSSVHSVSHGQSCGR
jgi:hypothetical protein